MSSTASGTATSPRRQRRLSLIDRLISETDTVMRTLANRGNTAGRESPAAGHSEAPLTETERKHVAGLMRVNHTGEVCAQALYQGQALTALGRLASAPRATPRHTAAPGKSSPPWGRGLTPVNQSLPWALIPRGMRYVV